MLMEQLVAGTLSFMCYYLLKNPESMRRLREEIDEVLGDQEIQLADLNKLPYLIGQLSSYCTPATLGYFNNHTSTDNIDSRDARNTTSEPACPYEGDGSH